MEKKKDNEKTLPAKTLEEQGLISSNKNIPIIETENKPIDEEKQNNIERKLSKKPTDKKTEEKKEEVKVVEQIFVKSKEEVKEEEVKTEGGSSKDEKNSNAGVGFVCEIPRLQNTFSQMKKKQYKVVMQFEVKTFGQFIKMNLVKNNIPFTDISKHLFIPELKTPGFINVAEISKILEKFPFELKHEQGLLLLSRYLVEDFSHDYIIFDETATKENALVEAIFKKLLGQYNIFTEESIKTIKTDLNKIYNEYQEMIMDDFAKIKKTPGIPKGSVNEEGYNNLMKVLSKYKATSLQLEYMAFFGFIYFEKEKFISIAKLFEAPAP